MFDVSFFELIIIGLIALLVLGPTKLLEVARFSGRWLGRIRRQFNDMKSDIDRELQLEEMRTRLAAEERALRDNLSLNPVEPSIAKPAAPANAVSASSSDDRVVDTVSERAPGTDQPAPTQSLPAQSTVVQSTAIQSTTAQSAATPDSKEPAS